ncbi:heat shock protein 26 [Scaptodrosophila lebanonensis]|uniref:Heat shock protein 26 n=1 Tax=Drosophila lebanonensis TaxID=7225 RepID=A0A6J2T996_DROLE|nr:heat shock protein 26 [Scaptodrosophila lebanonensis]
MALSQLLSLVDELHEPRSPVYDFGLSMHPRHLHTTWATPQRLAVCPCASPACPASPAGQMLAARHHTREATKKSHQDWPMAAIGKDGFQVCMDVAQFKPSELNVKVVDNSIVVEGKHEERQDDHGYIARHFVRRYNVPQGYEPEKVASSLSSDGVLTVTIPKPQPIADKTKERVIQIQQVGPAHLNVKQNQVEDKENKDKEKATNGSAKK